MSDDDLNPENILEIDHFQINQRQQFFMAKDEDCRIDESSSDNTSKYHFEVDSSISQKEKFLHDFDDFSSSCDDSIDMNHITFEMPDKFKNAR